MTPHEKAQLDLIQIERIKAFNVRNYGRYKTILLEKIEQDGLPRVRFWIDDVKVLYYTPEMFDLHLFGGIESAKQKFFDAGNMEDYDKAVLFEAFIPGAEKIVLAYSAELNKTLVFAKDTQFVFENGALVYFMGINAYPKAKEYLETL